MNFKYDVRKLLSKEGEDFVNTAYEMILGRTADSVGLDVHLRLLQNGVSKENIIFEMKISEEGIKKDLPINNFNIKKIDYRRLEKIEGEDFVKASYLAILGRSADEIGLQHHVDFMKQGLSKAEIIFGMSNSSEGKKLNVNVVGLKFAYLKAKVLNKLGCRKTNFDLLVNKNSCEAHPNYIIEDNSDLSEGLLVLTDSLNEIKSGFTDIALMDIKKGLIFKSLTEINNTSVCLYEDDMIIKFVEKIKFFNNDSVFVLDFICSQNILPKLHQIKDIYVLGISDDKNVIGQNNALDCTIIEEEVFTYLNNTTSDAADVVILNLDILFFQIEKCVEILLEAYRVLKTDRFLVIKILNIKYKTQQNINIICAILEKVGFKQVNDDFIQEYEGKEVNLLFLQKVKKSFSLNV